MSLKYKQAVVFGVFDRLHEGHRDFLRQALELADACTVVVARDSAVVELKNKTPRDTERARMASLRATKGIADVVLGDVDQGTYEILKKLKPDVILLGYDQGRLAEDLAAKMASGALPNIPLVRLMAHKPEQLHTSIIHKVETP